MTVCALPIIGSIQFLYIIVELKFGIGKAVKTVMGSPLLLYILVINVTVHNIYWAVVMTIRLIVVHVINLIVVVDDIEIYLL